MSNDQNPTPHRPMIFYLDGSKSDFTFYLDATNNPELLEQLRTLSGDDKQREKAEKTLSVSEEISFTSLVLGTGSIKTIDEKFWTRLVSGEPPYEYLLDKLNGSGHETTVARVRSHEALNSQERTDFAQLLDEILTKERLQDLLEQPFANCDQSILTALEGRPDQLEGYKRFLIAASFPEFTWSTESGRALLCLSHAGRYLSVTVRKLKKGTGYRADFHKRQTDRTNFLFSAGEYCRALYEEVFTKTYSTKHAQGLLVVTGSTNSLKSEIARGLIDLYLQERAKDWTPKDRAHHLVTFEDPIEKFYYNAESRGPAFVAVPLGEEPRRIDYTPRQKHRDAPALRAALDDALRQTPAVFFVGETRDKREWEVLLDFAATGHLIVTTAHAGSLVEAMHKIFEACKVQTSGHRAEIASKMLGLIHLRGGKIVHGLPNPEKPPQELEKSAASSVLIPAIWRRTGRGVAALTSNGLASLLPERPSQGVGNQNSASCLGRRWFIEELVRHARPQLEEVFGERLVAAFEARPNKKTDSIVSQLHRQAREWDLQGV